VEPLRNFIGQAAKQDPARIHPSENVGASDDFRERLTAVAETLITIAAIGTLIRRWP
jgi:hypothetical protein